MLRAPVLLLPMTLPAITITPPERVCFPTPPLPATEYLDVPGGRQKQLKQTQKEAEKRAKKEAREYEKQKSIWEKGQREREKLEEKEAREMERMRQRASLLNGGTTTGTAIAAGSNYTRSNTSSTTPASTRERKISNAMGFDKYGDALAGQMGALDLNEARRERRLSNAPPPPPSSTRPRKYSNAGYEGVPLPGPVPPPAGMPAPPVMRYAPAAYEDVPLPGPVPPSSSRDPYMAGYENIDRSRAAAAAAAQDDAYQRAYYAQYDAGGRAPAQAAGYPGAGPWDRERDRERIRERAERDREYASRDPDDPYPPGMMPIPKAPGVSRDLYAAAGTAPPPGGVPYPGAGAEYATAGADAYRTASGGSDPYRSAGGAGGDPYRDPYGAYPGSGHPSPSGYPQAAQAGAYARDPPPPVVHDPRDPYGSAPSAYYAAGAGAAGGGRSGYERSPYGAGAPVPPLSAAAAAATPLGAYPSPHGRDPRDPYSRDPRDAAGPSAYATSTTGRSPYDRHSMPPPPRAGEIAAGYAAVPPPSGPGSAYGAPSPGHYDRGHQRSASAYPDMPPLGSSHSPIPYPAAAAHAYATHINSQDPSSAAGADPYGARRASGVPFRPPSAAPADPAPSSPPGFHRPPSSSHAYTPFEAFLILDDLDGFYRETPHMPAALVSHDVFHEDWIRFMQDLAFAWSGRIPAPELARNGRPPHPGVIVADLVDVWNARFFRPRHVELIVYRGRQSVSGRSRGGQPGDDEFEDEHTQKQYSLCLRCLPQRQQ
ncbi:hypothetical protein EXIGLDRAFT_770760 [Exidia glandulosa HHB12029]|uniref:Uncharacterized protein n=1 Tax=Exidia glandulosa HHB12029 TaxID=1314781 RepID=A0A166AC36_EXIGL|nr:hypothetical protein EXIGLDRAFT_770760 [Exidia glandulosa HHB12029]